MARRKTPKSETATEAAAGTVQSDAAQPGDAGMAAAAAAAPAAEPGAILALEAAPAAEVVAEEPAVAALEAAPADAALPDAGAPALSAAGGEAATAEGLAAPEAAPAHAAGEPGRKAFAAIDIGALRAKRRAAAGFIAARLSSLPKPHLSRAATVALAAGLGVVAGAVLSASLFSRSADADQPQPIAALQGSVGALAAEIRALKTEFTAASRDAAAGLAALGERLDRSEKAEADLAAKVAALSAPKAAPKPVAKPPAAADVTGSIRRGDPAAVRRADAAPDKAGDPAAAPAKVPTVARGWVLWRVQNGRALVHGNGRYYEVGPGSRIPGLGVVQKIGEENGRAFVATERGMILSGRG